MLYHTKTADQALQSFGVSRKGLSASEVEERRKTYGLNSIRTAREPLWHKVIEPFANVFIGVLLIAVAISFFQKAYVDGAIILAIILISAIIYYIQKFSTERILRTLHKHNKHEVEAFRDNTRVTLDASLLVPGDIILVHEGEKIPADARLLDVGSLRVDESQLTGESQPVGKQTGKLLKNVEAYEQINMIFQGSFVVSGEASAVVVATGNATEFGKLAALTSSVDIQGPIQKKIDKLISQIIIVASSLGVVAFGLSLARGMEIGESLRFVIALAVSAVPEGLPVAISVILVLGMRRMAAKKALVRNMRAIETLGALTTIATDKTGTLTKNMLAVEKIWQLNETSNFVKILGQTINQKDNAMYDPLDIALHDYVKHNKSSLSRNVPLESFPFDHATSMSGNLWHHGDTYDLAIKGAPEAILARSDLSENEHEQATAELHRMSSNGYRVIALAHATLQKPLANLAELPKKISLEFDGFIGVADTLRPEAARAIKAASKAGVTVRMITGDHFETAFHIAKQLGMATHQNQIFDSRRMTVMTDEELGRIIPEVRVFSRVTPDRKYRLLTLMKKQDITAMTGDGVNDVPALAAAHVGIAMGSGAGIAKDAGDIILLDNNFRSIISAMREGRAIIANIRRMLYYLLTTSAGEVLTMIGALIIGMPLPLLPVQILWVNLVTDTALVIPLGLEPSETRQMKEPPHKPSVPILGRPIIIRIALVATAMAITIITIYLSYSAAQGHVYAQTIAFSTLVVMQWSNAFCARSERGSVFGKLRTANRRFYVGLTAAVILQVLILFSPFGNLLHVVSVAPTDLMATALIGFAVPILVVGAHRLLTRLPK